MPVEVEFHRLVQKDMDGVRTFYSQEAGKELADRFYFRFLEFVDRAAKNPKRYHFCHGAYRRANIKGFPYHFLYRETASGIWILVLRHDKRHPSFGLARN